MFFTDRPGRPIGAVLARSTDIVARGCSRLCDASTETEQPGSRWVWTDALRRDPLHEEFARSTDCCQLHFEARRGRFAATVRDVQRGELLMQVLAAGVVRSSAASQSLLAQACASDGISPPVDLASVGIDASIVALTVALLEDPAAPVDDAASSLLSHEESLSSADYRACLQLARNLRRLVAHRRGPQCGRAGGSVSESDEGVARLLLAVKSNAHAVLDDETASTVVGLGLYPAACLLNHSCSPSAAICFSSGGAVLQVRALCDLKRGQEVTYSYLDEAQLFTPWAQRQSLLRAAHHFEPTQPRMREVSEGAALCRCLVPADQLARLTKRVHELTGNVSAAAQAAQVAADALGPAAAAAARAATPARSGAAAYYEAVNAELAARMTSLRISVGSLRSLLGGEVRSQLHSAHWLVHDCLAALIQAARALDDPGLLAYASLQLINAREEVLPLGTLGLAALYASHGSAMLRLLKGGRVPQAAEVEALGQAEQALAAACRIRKCCLGDEHPLVQLTARAHADMLRRRRAYTKARKDQQ